MSGGGRAWLAAGAIAALLLTGCGSSQDDAVRQAVTAFGDAVTAGDYPAACDALAPPTAAELASQDGSCAEGLAAADLPPVLPVNAISVYSGSAQVVGAESTTFLVVDAGQWRVVAAGCQSSGSERPYDCEVSKG